MSMKRLALVTDAWQPQTNGVVNTLVRLVEAPRVAGDRGAGRSRPTRTARCRCRPTRRSASRCDPWTAIPRIRAFAPDAVHVATEGPLGFWTVGWLRRAGPALHDQLPHPLRRVPERAPARAARVGLQAGALVPRARRSTRWSARCRCCDELRGAARRPATWCTGRAASTRRSSTREHRRDDVYAAAAADLALRRARRRREEPGGLPGAAAAGHQGRGRRRSVARGARSAASPTSCGAAIASATIWRRTSPAPTASCSRRAPRPSATCCSRRWPRACRWRRCRRPARSTSSRRASTARSTTTCCDACLRALALLAREGARQHRGADAAGGPRGVPRPPGAAAAADAGRCRRAPAPRRAARRCRRRRCPAAARLSALRAAAAAAAPSG